MVDAKLIKWLRECYREDHTRAGIRDFFSSGVENRLVVRSDDRLACGLIDEDVLTPAYTEKLEANLALHVREKEFLYGCIFLTGEIGQKKYRAPLILYPASLNTDEAAAVVCIEHMLYRINYSLLDVLDNKEQIEEGIVKAMQSQDGVLTVSVVSDIARVISSAMPEIDVSKMLEWPHLVQVTSSQASEGLHFVPAAGWCVVKRSRGSSGVIDELGDLAELDVTEWSSALQTLLTGGVEAPIQSGRSSYITPAVLSENQAHLLKSARQHNLTICHGPPGTGKSFTIANIAIDHILRGHSVLIVSKKDHAVDVIYDIIAELLDSDESIVRAGRSHYLRNLKGHLSSVLSSRVDEDLEDDKKLTRKFRALLKLIYNLEKDFNDECEASLSRGAIVADPNIKWYKRPLYSWYRYKASRRPLLLDYTSQIDRKKSEKEILVRELISKRTEIRINKATKEYRKEIKGLLKAIRKTKSSDQMKAFKQINFAAVLKIFPIWLTSLSDVHRVLPFRKELFDVVIIDEASQCDMASVLPAIERAKRVVVAGDAKQLRHISFVSRNRMQKLAQDLNIDKVIQEKYDYRSISLMDLAIENTEHGQQVATLNEHFRSVDSIISFSNKHFYNEELRVMRERRWEAKSNSEVELYYCQGKRSSTGVNTQEIEALIETLDKMMKCEIKSSGPLSSIGILSPFRSQVDAITKRVQQYAQMSGYVHRLTKHQLKVGTAHSFQGEERDIMLISFALSATDNAGVRRFLEQEDVFNVSITRAKERQIIFHSVLSKDLPMDSLLAKYLNSVTDTSNRDAYKGSESSLGDKFAESFTAACSRYGIETSLYQSIASIPVDILLEKDGLYLGVDLIGYPGYTKSSVGIVNHQILDRVGLKLVPVGFVEWNVRPDEIMTKLVELFRQPK